MAIQNIIKNIQDIMRCDISVCEMDSVYTDTISAVGHVRDNTSADHYIFE